MVFNNTREDGFTLMELFVVIVTVAILGVLLLPALAGTKPNSQAFQCLENLRQLTLGWQMYAEDNNGKLVPNGNQATQPGFGSGVWPTDYVGTGKFCQWAPGTMNWFSPLWTNYLQASLLYPYVKTVVVFKCPADQRQVNLGGGITRPRVRSYSMNCYLSPVVVPADNNPKEYEWPRTGQGGTRAFFKVTELVRPGPSMTYLLIDENETTINDGFFVSDPNQGLTTGGPYMWQDIPATRHGNAGSLSYADGHVEMKAWRDKAIQNFNGINGPVNADPGNSDCAWLQQRATTHN
jgi:prepilin-type processing-associated H-X9-DG protein